MSEQNTGQQHIKLSVVIPAYNAEATIARALESVLAQSCPAHEIIVVNDASTDNTADIVAHEYAGRVKLIEKIQNCGSSVARNTGIDAATGNYIAFLDADDVWHKDKLSLVDSILSAQSNIYLFYHPYTQEDLHNKKLPEKITLYKLPFIKLLPANLIATSCAVIKNLPQFRFNTSMRYTEDYDLWLQIGYKYKIYFTDIPLTQIFRPFLSKGGISANRWKMRKGEMKAYMRLLRLNVLFIFLLPFLLLSSLAKYLYKLTVRK